MHPWPRGGDRVDVARQNDSYLFILPVVNPTRSHVTSFVLQVV
jgi:hypothetical protein